MYPFHYHFYFSLFCIYQYFHSLTCSYFWKTCLNMTRRVFSLMTVCLTCYVSKMMIFRFYFQKIFYSAIEFWIDNIVSFGTEGRLLHFLHCCFKPEISTISMYVPMYTSPPPPPRVDACLSVFCPLYCAWDSLRVSYHLTLFLLVFNLESNTCY